MMSLTDSAEIIQHASELLNDPEFVRWSGNQMVRLLQEGISKVVQFRPEAFTSTEYYQLQGGSEQEIPRDAERLIDLVNNATLIQTPDPSYYDRETIRFTRKEALDRHNPNWQMDAPTTTIKHFCLDLRDPRKFYVWPPSCGGTRGVAKAVWSKKPPRLVGNVFKVEVEAVGAVIEIHENLSSVWTLDVIPSLSPGSSIFLYDFKIDETLEVKDGIYVLEGAEQDELRFQVSAEVLGFDSEESPYDPFQFALSKCPKVLGPIPIGKEYKSALVDWVVGRAFQVDSDYAANGARTQMHLQSFYEALGIGKQTALESSLYEGQLYDTLGGSR